MNDCPRAAQCAHRAKLKLHFDGTCADCGTQICRPSQMALYENDLVRAARRRPYDRQTEPDLFEVLVARTATL